MFRSLLYLESWRLKNRNTSGSCSKNGLKKPLRKVSWILFLDLKNFLTFSQTFLLVWARIQTTIYLLLGHIRQVYIGSMAFSLTCIKKAAACELRGSN